MNDQVVLSADNLVVGYGQMPLLPPMSFGVQQGQVVAIVGRNGSGKSTLMKTLLGTLAPLSGQVVWQVKSRHVALMPQTKDLDFQLPITVREFVSWGSTVGLSFLKGPWMRRSIRQRVDASLEKTGLSHLGNKFLNELSEGQQQRVLFARVLASDAPVAMLDEPTAAMDAVFQTSVMSHLHHLAKERHTSVILITHALELLGSIAEQVIFLDQAGQQVVAGPKEQVLSHPAFLREFQGNLGTGKHVTPEEKAIAASEPTQSAQPLEVAS